MLTFFLSLLSIIVFLLLMADYDERRTTVLKEKQRESQESKSLLRNPNQSNYSNESSQNNSINQISIDNKEDSNA